MPEGPEVRVVADAVAKGIGTIFEGAEIIENVPGTPHRYSRNKPDNWSVIANSRWQLVKARTKGKLILLDIKTLSNDESWVLLITLGMSGDLRWNSAGHKHTRFAFLKVDGGDLSMVDIRCFGSLRIVTPEKAKKLEAKLGYDLLNVPMEPNYWDKLQFHKKLSKMEIKPALMTQNFFSGLGNIYTCETLYELGIDPRRTVSQLDPKKWGQINQTAHVILQKAYLLNGSSVKDYTFDGKKGEAQTLLKVYGRETCPKGYKIRTIQQDERTTWFVPELQIH
jgi:formamidopyrimidine-DNA glycosylase